MTSQKMKALQSQNRFLKDFKTDDSYGKAIRMKPPFSDIRNNLELTNFIVYISELLGLKTSKRNMKTKTNLNIYITYNKNILSQYLSTLEYYCLDNNPTALEGVEMPDMDKLKSIYQNIHNELDTGIEPPLEIFKRNSSLLCFDGAAVCSFMVSFDSDGNRVIVAGYKITKQGNTLHKAYPDYVYEEKLKIKNENQKKLTTDLQDEEPQMIGGLPEQTDLFFNPLDSDSELFF